MISGVFQGGLRFLKTNKIEIQFSTLFVCTVIVNKYVLSEFRFIAPTGFQGWQTFTCVILLSALLKLGKVTEQVKMPDRRTFITLLPGFICFAVSIVAGSKGLSELPVPVFCAILSLNPAILILLDKKTDFSDSSKRVCGSVAICGTVVVTLVISLNKWNTEGYLWLLSHVILSVMYTLYMEKVNLEISSTAKIYFRNCFSVVVLLPVSIYLGVLYLPRNYNWEFYLGCILSGVLGTFLQITTAKIEGKLNYVNCQGRSKLICSLIAHNLFFANVEPIIWFVIIVNLLINSTVMSPEVENLEVARKPNLTVFVGPPQRRDLNFDGIISV